MTKEKKRKLITDYIITNNNNNSNITDNSNSNNSDNNIITPNTTLTTTTTTTTTSTSTNTSTSPNVKKIKKDKKEKKIKKRKVSTSPFHEQLFWNIWENENITNKLLEFERDELIPYFKYEDANSIKWMLNNNHIQLFIYKVKNRDTNLTKWYYLNQLPDEFTKIQDREFYVAINDLLFKYWHLMERRLQEFVLTKIDGVDRNRSKQKKSLIVPPIKKGNRFDNSNGNDDGDDDDGDDNDELEYDLEKWIRFSNHNKIQNTSRYIAIVQDVISGDNVENAKKVIEHCKYLHLITLSPSNKEIINLLSLCTQKPKITLENVYESDNFEEIVELLLEKKLITKAETHHMDQFHTMRNLVYLLKNGFNYHFEKINANMKKDPSKILCIPTFFKLTDIMEREMIFYEDPFYIRECILNFTQQEFSLISYDYPKDFNFADYITNLRLYRYPSIQDYDNITDLNRINVTELAKAGCIEAIRAYMNRFYPSLEATTPHRKENVLNLLHTAAKYSHTHIYRMLADEFPHVYIFVHTPETKGKDIFDFEELKSIYIALNKANWILCDYILDELLLVPPLNVLAEYCKINVSQMVYLAIKYPKIRFSFEQTKEFYTYPTFVKLIESKNLLDCWMPRNQLRKKPIKSNNINNNNNDN